MAFDQADILDVAASRQGADLLVSWASSAPAGTTYQVYVGRRLAHHGTGTTAAVPYPVGRATIDVGAVGTGEALTDFSAALPPPDGGGERVSLAWQGGTYLDPDLASFSVYLYLDGFGLGGFGDGGFGTTGPDYLEPTAAVAAYPGGRILDGFGYGGFGSGGFGQAASDYTWTSDPQAPGTWAYAVVPVDTFGNAGTPLTGDAVVAGPPRPPARGADGKRVRYTFHAGPPVTATLSWLASPDY